MLSAREIASSLGPLLKSPLRPEDEARIFSRAAVDSRAVAPGGLFVALPGAHADGHQFIPDALQRGAAGVIARHWPDLGTGDQAPLPTVFLVDDPLAALHRLAEARRAAVPVRTIGVTGSVGKTSTKEAVAGLLSRYFPLLKSPGNLNTEIGLPLVLLDLAPEHRYLVVEMAMYGPGEIAQLCRLARPGIGIITNVGPVHLERLGTLDRIAAAKAELVESLPLDGLAVLNADDPRVAAMASRTNARTVTFGMCEGRSLRSSEPPGGGPDCCAADIQVHGLQGVSFSLHWHGNRVEVRAPLVGRHSVYACLAAAAVALSEGLSLHQVAGGLASLETESRIKIRKTSSGVTVLDDSYNASPASVIAALDLLGEMPGRRIAVLGDMLELGPEEDEGHRQVGRHAARKADALIAIGPRMALAARTARLAGLKDVQHFEHKAGALARMRDLAIAGDAYVLIKASRGIALEELVTELWPTP